MITSQNGIERIKSFESFQAKAYTCPAGKLTIGYGHVILPDEDLGHVTVTERGAEDLLKEDLEGAEQAVNRANLKIDQDQFDALVSFVFNVGVGAFQGSTLLKRIRVGDMQGAADEFLKWNHGGGKVLAGLTRRREVERQLFLGDAS